jgi:alcohol/geraniol dehydrogenase (NADP+)
MGPGGPLHPYEYEAPPLGPLDVEVEISHCGICHTDLHLIDDNPPGLGSFPLVPGHEIVGTVVHAGPAVSHVSVGQRVGIGPLAGACYACELCLTGREQICPRAPKYLPFGIPGGYASHVRVDARCAYPIPAALPSAAAAPLLCAGATVFAPLARHAGCDASVGVIGVGGLGHLALQYARAMGCEVTAFSSTPGKEEEARAFGAHEFVVSGEDPPPAGEAGRYDLILCTAPADVSWTRYVMALKPEGTLCVVGLPASDIAIPALPLLFGQRRIVGSLIGSAAESQAMLRFSARHNILPQVEVCPMADANAALARLRRNDVRYRIVLAN